MSKRMSKMKRRESKENIFKRKRGSGYHIPLQDVAVLNAIDVLVRHLMGHENFVELSARN